MKTLSTDRVIAQISECSVSSSADLGNLLLAFVEGKSYPMTASEAHLEIIKKVKALRFNDKNEKRDFVSELILWVTDGRLPIPNNDVALMCLLDLHRTVCMNATTSAYAFEELMGQYGIVHSFYQVISQFMCTYVVNMPKNLASWSLIVVALAKRVKLIYVEALTFNNTIDIISEDFVYETSMSILKHDNDFTAAYKLRYCIKTALSHKAFSYDATKKAFDIINRLHKETVIDLNSYMKEDTDKDFFIAYNVIEPVIYNKYPESISQLSSLFWVVKLYKFIGDNEIGYEKFFHYLPLYFFAFRYESPSELLYHIGSGKNVRTYPILGELLSKKAAHIFHNLALNEVNLQNCLIYAHSKSLGINTELMAFLMQFIRLSWNDILVNPQGQLMEDWQLFTSMGLFLQRNEVSFSTLGNAEKHLIVGYITHCFHEVAAYSLNGRTLASVQRAANEWQEENNRNRNVFNNYDNFTVYSWEGAPYQEWNQLGNDKLWYAIFQLTTQSQLNDESAFMSHCVRGYGSDCASDYCSIWSLRMRKDKTWVPLATVEVNDSKQIVQVKAKYNAIPAEKYLRMVGEWATQEYLSVVRY